MADNHIIASRLARVELLSAFERKRHEGLLTADEAARLWRVYLTHEAQQYKLFDVTSETLVRAEELLRRRHPLRAADAIHVATALIASEGAPDLLFVTADRRQADAAEAEGLAVQFIE